MKAELAALERAIGQAMSADRHRLRMAVRRLRGQREGQEKPQSLQALAKQIDASCARAEVRRARLPQVHYPSGLPVSERVAEIRDAIAKHQVVIVAGETGSGKTTQLPKICLELGRGIHGMIGHTQPRRLAARTVANRIAEELGVQGGKEVGYQVRFSDLTDDTTYIKLMTDGILLAETQHDRFLNRYDTLIIDEAHERSLNIDFLLGYLKRLLPRRPDLKLIITSATIDVEKFSRHFGDAPIVEVSGRTYPVEMLYRPPLEEGDDSEQGERIIEAIRELLQRERHKPPSHGDILVFLSGEKEIRDVANDLRKAQLPHIEVLPLYARLSNAEQNRVFQSHKGRRVVLATNVAETSLTVPGIGYVIDTGTARISRYSVRSKVQRLPIEAISQASANQRAGRCGRLGPGTCVRLYSEEDFLSRSAFTDTEIMRTHLGSVILQMLALNLGDISSFPFVDSPDSRAVNDGFNLLEEIGAVDGRQALTQAGRRMARLPVDPKFARMILEAAETGCLREVLIIVSALSIQDPRERPHDRQQAADEKHRQHQHPESDFLSLVNLWESFEVQRQELPRNHLRKYCQQQFLSFMRMREWREVHRQLHLVCQELKLRENREPAAYEQIHRALLSGLLSQVANLIPDQGLYLGARNRKYQVFPGSVLFRKKVRWLLSAELVETSQLYARMNARIEPEWIEQLGAHLLKHHYFEPHWEKRQGRVMAYEKVTLLGLTLVEKRRVAYGRIDPAASRAILIREALVGMQLNTRCGFFSHNRQLVESVRAMEDKTRRRDILVDEEAVFAFYDRQLPTTVFDVASLERWWRQAVKREPRLLFLSEQDLISDVARTGELAQFPDRFESGGMALDLAYAFKPGERDDGVSVNVPLVALRQLREEDLDWLVPGMLRDKCIALVKALPKHLRKQFVPVPDVVDRILQRLDKQAGSLKLALARELKRLSGIDVPLAEWQDFQLDEHLRMNIKVLDENGVVVAKGRDLSTLRAELAPAIERSVGRHSQSGFEREGITTWNFGELPAVYEIEQGGIVVKAYPALVDEGGSVALRLLDSPYKATLASRAGIVRLALLSLGQQEKYLRKQLLKDPRRLLSLKHIGGRDSVLTQLIRTACLEAFELEQRLPRSDKEFKSMFESGRSRLVEAAERIEALLYRVLDAYQEVLKELSSLRTSETRDLTRDVENQLSHLIFSNFMFQIPWQWLKEYPRYLKAISLRLEKYPRQATKDEEWRRRIAAFWEAYRDRKAYCDSQDMADEELERFRWMLEEYRVSLYAQALGTRMPVSESRLEKQWLKCAGAPM